MTNFSDSDQISSSGSEELKGDSIRHLYSKINEMPEIMESADLVDHLLASKFNELITHSQAVIEEFQQQKSAILEQFDHRLVPVAREVLDSLLQDADQLASKLNRPPGEHRDQFPPLDWIDYAKRWTQLYAQWNDGKALAQKVLELVAARTEQLIDKDIQVIHDYQKQSLEHLSKGSETFKNLEKRLAKATDEPLKQLSALRNQHEQHMTLTQASEWISRLQEQRERYFDQLLMKIDHVVKEVVQMEDVEEEAEDFSVFSEDEGEIVFMEREIRHIQALLPNMQASEESDIIFMEARLEGLLDHAEQVNIVNLRYSLHKRLTALKNQFEEALTYLKEL